MVQTMSSPADFRTTPRRVSGDDRATFLSRWLKVWVLLLTVVTLVVVVYLILITNSLAHINGNLATADRAVTGAGGNVVTLPNQVERINGALSEIDPALRPIPGQANQIIANLTSINDKLTATDSSLKDTSSILVTVLGQVNDISGVLINADDPPDRLGVQNIHERVARLNGINSRNVGATRGGGPGVFGSTPGNLTAAKVDADNILSGLVSVNAHLTSACKSTVVQVASGGVSC